MAELGEELYHVTKQKNKNHVPFLHFFQRQIRYYSDFEEYCSPQNLIHLLAGLFEVWILRVFFAVPIWRGGSSVAFCEVEHVTNSIR